MFQSLKNFIKKYPLFFFVGVVVIIFAIGLFWGQTSKPTPTIQHIEPPNNLPTNIFPVFKITFDRVPTRNQKNHFVFRLNPEISLISIWQDNVATLTPTTGLNLDSVYTLSLYYDQNLLTALNYTTVSLDQLSTQDAAKIQTEADFNFAQEQQKLLQEKPWLNLLPISTNEYTIVYDFDLQKIRIRLKVPYSQAQRTVLLQNLAQKGIPTGSVMWIEK